MSQNTRFEYSAPLQHSFPCTRRKSNSITRVGHVDPLCDGFDDGVAVRVHFLVLQPNVEPLAMIHRVHLRERARASFTTGLAGSVNLSVTPPSEEATMNVGSYLSHVVCKSLFAIARLVIQAFPQPAHEVHRSSPLGNVALLPAETCTIIGQQVVNDALAPQNLQAGLSVSVLPRPAEQSRTFQSAGMCL